MQGKDMLTLWILFCRVDAHGDTFFPFYARDLEEAERQAEKILQEHCYERLELKEYPYGFRIVMTTLPGRIEENAE
jgi:hypothetical protein